MYFSPFFQLEHRLRPVQEVLAAAGLFPPAEPVLRQANVEDVHHRMLFPKKY